MTRFQKYRQEAYDKLYDKHRNGSNPNPMAQEEILRRAEFAARMRMAKEAKRNNLQWSLFQSGSTN